MPIDSSLRLFCIIFKFYFYPWGGVEHLSRIYNLPFLAHVHVSTTDFLLPDKLDLVVLDKFSKQPANLWYGSIFYNEFRSPERFNWLQGWSGTKSDYSLTS